MYYLVFVIGILLSLVNNKMSAKMFVIILALLAFFRYGVGADYFAYNYLYDQLSDSLFDELINGSDRQEPLFRLIGSLFKKMGMSYQQYLIVFAFFNLLFIYKICSKYSENPTLSLLLYYCSYYFVWTFSGLRQGVVLAIGLYYLLEGFEKDRTRKFVVIVFLLSLIHQSALILLPLFFMARLNYGKHKLLFLFGISLFISIVPLELLVQPWFPFYERVSPYIDSNSAIANVLDFQSIARMFFLFLGLMYYNSYKSINTFSLRQMNVYVISIICYFCLKSSELIASRLAVYGMSLIIVILPNIYYIYKNKANRLIYISFLLILCTLYFNKEIITLKKQSALETEGLIIPYTSIYNKNEHQLHSEI